jgi:hypothetical protein
MPSYINESNALRKVILQLIQHEQLQNLPQISCTNVFILFHRQTRCTENSDLYEIRNFKLNKSCRQFSIHFRDTTEFEIFQEDFDNLTLAQHNLNHQPKQDTSENHFWYQSKIFVKGFNDVLVNNQSIWS